MENLSGGLSVLWKSYALSWQRFLLLLFFFHWYNFINALEGRKMSDLDIGLLTT
jgi:hypothetical protein